MRVQPSIPILAALLFQGCAAAPAALAPQYYGAYRATVYLDVGQRCVDSSFDPVDDQTAAGFTLDIRQPGAATGLVLGLHHSWDEGSKSFAGVGSVDFESYTTDFTVGSRWIGPPISGRLRPYFGAGVALVFAGFSTNPDVGDSSDDSDFTVGPYVQGGIEWPFDERFSVGLQYTRVLLTRTLRGIDLGDTSTDADYGQIALSLGYSF